MEAELQYPLCPARVIHLRHHLKNQHQVNNTEERQILIKHSRGRTLLWNLDCPVCGLRYHLLERHLKKRQGLTQEQLDNHVKELKWASTVQKLRELRKNPEFPMVSTFDLVQGQPEENQEPLDMLGDLDEMVGGDPLFNDGPVDGAVVMQGALMEPFEADLQQWLDGPVNGAEGMPGKLLSSQPIGHRGGVLQNMTIAEVMGAKYSASEKAYLINITSHKTNHVYGPAQIVFTKEEYTWALRFLEIKDQLPGGTTATFFFFTSMPNPCKNLNNYFQEAWKFIDFPGTPTFTDIRTSIASHLSVFSQIDKNRQRVMGPL
nr:uncharacterized protein LOC129445926 [Misgurnus anguillicaudatus]